MLIAAAQMVSGPDRTKNLEVATRLVRRAVERGASLVGLPENVAWMGPRRTARARRSAWTGRA